MDAVLPAGRDCREGRDGEGVRESRIEVIVGCVVMSVVAFFIIVACAGAIHAVQPREISGAADAALGLRPFGLYAYLLFAAGLLNASVFAACIQPLSTAYTVCEGLGFESGVNFSFREAPVFYWLFTLLIVYRRRRGAAARVSRSSAPSSGRRCSTACCCRWC